MTRFKLFLAALCACAGLAVIPAASTATVVGDGAQCSVNAENPGYNGTTVYGYGEVDCSYSSTATLEVCLEKNTGGGWSGTYNCHTVGPYSNIGSVSAGSYGQTAGCGTWFRTWAGINSHYTDATGTHYGSAGAVSNANYRC